MEKDIKNITQLRDDMIKAYQQLRDKQIGLAEVKELSNMAGKIVSNAKAQLEYNRYAGSKSEIKFLKGN